MRKLIIGCGYLGRRVAAAWLAQGDTVHALTRSNTRAEELRAAGLQPIVGDVKDPSSIDFPEEIDVCLYAVGRDRSTGDSQRQIYVDALSRILADPRFAPRRLIYISSTSVYGQDQGEWIDADSPAVPTRENGQICLEAENLIRAFPRSECSILRLSGLYGPGRLIARTAQLKNREPLTGRPDAWLNLIHADDAAAAVLACEHRGTSGATYLITDDRPIPRRDYYSLLAKLTGAPEPIFAEENGPLGKRCSNTAAKQQLAWTLQFPTITEGLPHAIAGL